MELGDAIRRRRMVRSFEPRPLDTSEVLDLLDLARRAPSAGNTSAVEFLMLDSPAAVDRYWATTLPVSRRADFAFPALLQAPVLIVLTTRPQSYVDRYAEVDKQPTRLGVSVDDWTVPYWWVDAGAVAQNLLLLATARGLGACLFGLFEHEAAIAARFGIPADRRCVATIALGHATTDPGRPGRSAARPRPAIGEVSHRGRWGVRPIAAGPPARPDPPGDQT